MSWSMSLFGETLTTDRGVADPTSPKASTQIAAHGGEDEKGKKCSFCTKKGKQTQVLLLLYTTYALTIDESAQVTYGGLVSVDPTVEPYNGADLLNKAAKTRSAHPLSTNGHFQRQKARSET